MPQLLWDLGWFAGHKIGRADEHVQYRRLFKNDDEFHGDERPPGSDERDNWQVSKSEYQNGVDAVEVQGMDLGKKSEKIFYSSPAKSQMSYAEAISSEGEFAKSQAAWRVAGDDWRAFGDLWIEHSTGRRLRLGHEDELAELVDRLEQELESLAPGLRDKMVEERRAALTDEQRAALEIEPSDRDDNDWQIAQQAEQAILVDNLQLVKRIAKETPELRKKSSILAQQLADQRINLVFTDRYKADSNYDYWLLRAEYEQTDIAVEARRKMFEGKQAFENDQDTVKSKQLYDEGFAKWREVLDTFPELMDTDGVTGDDLMEYVFDYRDMLNQKGEQIADDFPLWDIIENFDVEQLLTDEVEARKRRLSGKADNSETRRSPGLHRRSPKRRFRVARRDCRGRSCQRRGRSDCARNGTGECGGPGKLAR